MSEAELVDVALGTLVEVKSTVPLALMTGNRMGPWLMAMKETPCILSQPWGALSSVIPLCPAVPCLALLTLPLASPRVRCHGMFGAGHLGREWSWAREQLTLGDSVLVWGGDRKSFTPYVF